MRGLKRFFPAYRLRLAVQEDAEALLRVHQRAILTLGRRVYNEAQLRSWATGNTSERYVKAIRDEGEVFEVAEARRAGIVAFCSRKDGEVRGLYVDPDWARHGIGSLLLNRAEAAIRAAGHDRVSIGASLVGLPFYEARGYTVLRHRHWKTRGGLFIPAAEMEKTVGRAFPRKAVHSPP
ncbi:GNAT family N-acetyltransferase [Pelagibius sp.]|uniref:GNAT family N-acetyltransferase n=1 Tax=Pelagibius sp. TaxID=1931238 RepID=UPI0026148529|nr:GNAT family N-acetyltransferase [Pelagibius sp.]